MNISIRVSLFFALVLIAASPTAARAQPPSVSHSPKAAKTRAKTAKTPDAPPAHPLLHDADEITKTVSSLRGLPIRRKIKRGVMNRDEIKDRVLKRFAEDFSDDEIRAEERALKRWGLLPQDADYKQMVVGLLVEQIAGFYDPRARELYIADWIAAAMQRPVLAHEIDHALQDQSFSLEALLKANKTNSDDQLARQALVEGDGLAVMIEYLFHEMGQPVRWSDPAIRSLMTQQLALGAAAELKHLPLYLRETLLFPYLAGVGLIAETRALNSWTRIDQMFRHPPRSTEQVLHPAKYFAGEAPHTVPDPDAPQASAWRSVFRNVVGELGWAIFLEQHGVARERARTAAEGWGGDRFVAFSPAKGAGSENDLLLVSFSSWDTEGEAVEAYQALGDALTKLGDVTGCKSSETRVRCSQTRGHETRLERKDDRIVLVIGAPRDQVGSLVQKSWAQWKLTPAAH